MNGAASDGHVRRFVGGGSLVLAADALQVPTALLLGAFLARQLGPEGLAIYLTAAAVITWIELSVSSLFSRATVQMVAETHSWEPVASLVLRWHCAAGFGAAALLLLALWPMEHVLAGMAGLRPALALFAIEIPLFALARAHTHVLVGLGRYRARAAAAAACWISRLVLGVGLVAIGLGVEGAIAAAVASSALELAVARAAVRPRLTLAGDPVLSRRLLRISTPLFAQGIALQLFYRLGLLVLVPLGASVSAAGLYGAADSLLRVRRVLGQSLTPLVLSTLTGLERDGASGEARRLASQALRAGAMTVVPIAAIAGVSTPLMAWVFGGDFAAAGSVLAWAIWGTTPMILLSLSSAALISAGRAGWTAALAVPMVPAAWVAYAVVFPRFGIEGVAAATTGVAVVAAATAIAITRGVCGVALPSSSFVRAVAAAAVTYGVAHRLAPAGQGGWVLLALTVATLAGGLTLVALREVTVGEFATLQREFRRRRGRSP